MAALVGCRRHLIALEGVHIAKPHTSLEMRGLRGEKIYETRI